MLAPDRRTFLISALALAACSDTDSTSAAGNHVDAQLIFLREEEKLARDVYLTLLATWGLPIFENIADAERRHMNAVLNVLNDRGIPDPIIDDTVGAFQSPALASLYTPLVTMGSSSENDALWVGCTIEDLDINDLDELDLLSDEPAVQRLVDSLRCGSENHMRSFHGALTGAGETYQVQYITQDKLRTILAGSNGGCGGR